MATPESGSRHERTESEELPEIMLNIPRREVSINQLGKNFREGSKSWDMIQMLLSRGGFVSLEDVRNFIGVEPGEEGIKAARQAVLNVRSPFMNYAGMPDFIVSARDADGRPGYRIKGKVTTILPEIEDTDRPKPQEAIMAERTDVREKEVTGLVKEVDVPVAESNIGSNEVVTPPKNEIKRLFSVLVRRVDKEVAEVDAARPTKHEITAWKSVMERSILDQSVRVRTGVDYLRNSEAYTLFARKSYGVLNKPSGMLSRFAPGEKNGIEDLYRYKTGETAYCVTPLDREVSGAIMMAHSATDLARLRLQGQLGLYRHEFVALLDGTFEDTSPQEVTTVVDKNGRLRLVGDEEDDAVERKPLSLQIAPITHYRTNDSRRRDLTLALLSKASTNPADFRLIAGHVLGKPMVGDNSYGLASEGAIRPLLHSHAITFLDPEARKLETVIAPLARDFRSILDGLRPMRHYHLTDI